MPNHPTYPVHLVVKDRPCLVVGAGNVAYRKITGLLDAEATITVIAPEVRPEIAALPVVIRRRSYEHGEAATGYQLVITCTDDRHVNRQVFRDADRAGVWVNSADDPVNCSFILPSVARRGDLAITVSTNGRSPALASWLRRRFESEFDERYEQLLDLLAETRAEVRLVRGTSEIPGWNEALDAGLFDLVAQGETEQARELLHASLGLTLEGAP